MAETFDPTVPPPWTGIQNAPQAALDITTPPSTGPLLPPEERVFADFMSEITPKLTQGYLPTWGEVPLEALRNLAPQAVDISMSLPGVANAAMNPVQTGMRVSEAASNRYGAEGGFAKLMDDFDTIATQFKHRYTTQAGLKQYIAKEPVWAALDAASFMPSSVAGRTAMQAARTGERGLLGMPDLSLLPKVRRADPDVLARILAEQDAARLGNQARGFHSRGSQSADIKNLAPGQIAPLKEPAPRQLEDMGLVSLPERVAMEQEQQAGVMGGVKALEALPEGSLLDPFSSMGTSTRDLIAAEAGTPLSQRSVNYAMPPNAAQGELYHNAKDPLAPVDKIFPPWNPFGPGSMEDAAAQVRKMENPALGGRLFDEWVQRQYGPSKPRTPEVDQPLPIPNTNHPAQEWWNLPTPSQFAKKPEGLLAPEPAPQAATSLPGDGQTTMFSLRKGMSPWNTTDRLDFVQDAPNYKWGTFNREAVAKGGMNKSEKVFLKNDPEQPYFMKTRTAHGNLGNEVKALQSGDIFGVDVLPVSQVGDDALLTPWVDGLELGSDPKYAREIIQAMDPVKRDKQVMYEFLMADTDKHSGNFFVDRTGKKIMGIDYGKALQGGIDQMKLKNAYWRAVKEHTGKTTALNKDAVSGMLSKRKAIIEHFKPHVTNDELYRLERRFDLLDDVMAKKGDVTFEEFDDMMKQGQTRLEQEELLKP